MAEPIIGIDLGTTNSCAAVADEDGEVTLIPYRGGEFTIPSIFAIDEKGKTLVGFEAKRQSQLNPRQTIHGSKRLIGVGYDSELVGAMRKHIAYDLEQGEQGDVVIPVGTTTMRVQDIGAKILGKIRDVASEYLDQSVARAVVTVPAYFNDRQRQAVRLAGDLTDLEIVRIINEPTAAALAYGAGRGCAETVAIYDLGGGTFDVSIIEIRDRVFEVKATGGDIFLGGIDFDNALIQFVLGEFKSAHGVDLASDPIAMQRIRDMAERVKIDLSARTEAPLNIPFITMTGDGQPLNVDLLVTREELETLVQPFVERTFDTCARVIDQAGMLPDQIDQVILVGGQTRMPIIHRRIEDFFGLAPTKSVHPDEAVAIGAALYAWSLDDRSDLSVQLLDVLPMAIGIEAARGSLHRLFERNCSVPNQRVFSFTTHRDDQKDLVMRIFQGDSAAAKENDLLGAFTFSGLRKGPAGSVRVEVVFSVSGEGILTLNAKDLDAGTVMRQSVHFDA